jgi:hypothetical protein
MPKMSKVKPNRMVRKRLACWSDLIMKILFRPSLEKLCTKCRHRPMLEPQGLKTLTLRPFSAPWKRCTSKRSFPFQYDGIAG